MKRPPTIIVQLVHIQGPLKGQIQEFADPEIVIGRKPSCHLRFPVNLTIVSREHATIIREGNRFRVVDKSVNGTFVNGKRIEEAYLKDGDVMSFAEGGPKVSFLTQMREASPEPPQPEQASPPQPEPRLPPESKSRGAAEQAAPPPWPTPEPAAPKDGLVQTAQVPLVIQYGPTLKSFREVPVAVGKSPRSGFVLDHPHVLDEHLIIFFHNDQYWVKDLTGRDLVQVNRHPISVQAPLAAHDEVALTPKGPVFRFLGAGRFAEVEEAKTEEPPQPAAVAPEKGTPKGKTGKGARSLFKKLMGN
jgi:pSer/pThr/pTyr-binding forkhead associated (FHA) protein